MRGSVAKNTDGSIYFGSINGLCCFAPNIAMSNFKIPPVIITEMRIFERLTLLFLLGIDVGGNEAIIKGLHTLGLEAIIITLAAVTGSVLYAWGLWYLLYIRNRRKETEA